MFWALVLPTLGGMQRFAFRLVVRSWGFKVYEFRLKVHGLRLSDWWFRLGGPPVIIRDHGNHIWVLSESYYATSTGLGGHPPKV